MKLQLILGGQEVELNQNISIPLNKTYENLSNPMDIIVDYSKSINIPITSKNNAILANSYRLDRTIPRGGETNLGLYLDPTKKIPMKLLYNSEVMLDGYAKFVSTNNSTKNKYYTLNLFGIIGDIFQKLRSVVLSETQLTEDQKAEEDGGAKYILHDRSVADHRYLNSSYIFDSWSNNMNNIYGYHYNEETGSTGGSVSSIDVIGFAPSYRGYYNDFESNSIQVLTTDEGNDEDPIIALDEYLTRKWKLTYSHKTGESEANSQAYAESLGAEDLVGDGFKDYQMREYRSYYMKPYIYFNQLLQMYQYQITKLSDYKLELDTNWFNVNNPYWTRMCYMLDFIDNKDSNQDTKEQVTSGEKLYSAGAIDAAGGTYYMASTSLVINDLLEVNPGVVLDPFTVNLRVGGLAPKASVAGWGVLDVSFHKSTYFEITTELVDQRTNASRTHKYYASFKPYETAKQDTGVSYITEENYIQIALPEYQSQWVNTDEWIQTGDINVVDNFVYFDLTIPIPQQTFDFSAVHNGGVFIDVYANVMSIKTPNLMTATFHNAFGGSVSSNIKATSMDGYTTGSVSPISILRNWRTNIPISLSNIYFKEDSPLFDVILQYTKMFGLLWVPDYNKKVIKLMHKSTYFDDITILDWNSKVDRSKDFIIEPVTFGSKYISFNYDDVDGYHYTSYRDKYNVNYGNKSISTGYDFGDKKDLFKGISPSSASSKAYATINDWYNWDLISPVPQVTDSNAFIDSEDEEQSSSISIYNWYLRGENKPVSGREICYITDDTAYQQQSGKYCWLSRPILESDGLMIDSMPTFNIAINAPDLFPNLTGRVLGGVFNTPNEDYTSSKLPSRTVGNSIYDLFWKNYINERYNVQNKKVTAYFNISPAEYIPFTFNKFVTLDNQLFIVNKIFDYDLNSKNLTKVELVQVTNKDVYRNGTEKFPYAVISPEEVNVIAKQGDEDNGFAYLTTQVTAFDEDGSLTRGDWSYLTGTLIYSNGTTSDRDEDIGSYVFIEYGDWESNIGRDTMVLYWNDMEGLIFDGKVDYVINGTTYTIPIHLDYRNSSSETQPQLKPTISVSPDFIDISDNYGEGSIEVTAYVQNSPGRYGTWNLTGNMYDTNGNMGSPSQRISISPQYDDLIVDGMDRCTLEYIDMRGYMFNGSLTYTVDGYESITISIPVNIDCL